MMAGQRRADQGVADRNTPNACGAKESAVTVGSMALAGKARRDDKRRLPRSRSSPRTDPAVLKKRMG